MSPFIESCHLQQRSGIYYILRLVLLKDIGDVFAADVMYHKKCRNKYLKQFQRDVDRLMQADFDKSGNEDAVTAAFNQLILTLDPNTTGYAVSDIRDALNTQLKTHGKCRYLFWAGSYLYHLTIMLHEIVESTDSILSRLISVVVYLSH